MRTIKAKIRRRYGSLQIRRRGFWFVDIPRTSSSSIRTELGQIYGIPYGKSNLIEKAYSTRQIFPDHLPARRMREILGARVWDRLFTFTFVRNPWDRMVSMYHYRKKIHKLAADISFRDYLRSLKEAPPDAPFYRRMSDYILGENEEVLVSFIGRYEHRARDLETVAREIGAPTLGALVIQRAAPQKTHYATYYDDETSAIVRTLYARDIDLFKYTFESR